MGPIPNRLAMMEKRNPKKTGSHERALVEMSIMVRDDDERGVLAMWADRWDIVHIKAGKTVVVTHNKIQIKMDW